jgi:signal transduction histidine kinase/AraC-like DNA-binding protein
MNISNMFSRAVLSRVIFWCLLLCSANKIYAQDTTIIKRASFSVVHEMALCDSTWLFHAGDFSKTELPITHTTNWDTLHRTIFGKQNPPRGWQGIAWFAQWVKVDTGLVGVKLDFRINHDGASEIFVDGKPVGGYGKVGNSAAQMEAYRAPRELIALWFSDTKPHLITMRYSNYFGVYPDFLGFEPWIGDYNAVAKRTHLTRQLFSFVPMCAAAEIILGLLHFLFFLFYPKQKLNLYYAFFVLVLGINTVSVHLFYQASIPLVQFYSEASAFLCKVLLLWSGVALLYVLDYGKVPRLRLLALTGVSLFYFTCYVLKFMYVIEWPVKDYFSLVFFIFMLDGYWSAFHLIKKRQRSIWLVIAGITAVTLVYFFAWDDTFDIWPWGTNSIRVFAMSIGQLILPVCLSLYLALNFARTNQNLSARLADVEVLSARALAQETEKTELIAAEAKRLEDVVEQRTGELRETAEKLREMDAVKSRFFTNITHEFKTPLTLIINPAKELLEDGLDNGAERNARLILNNAERLSQLISQLLDLSKLENGVMEITRQPLDLVALIRMHIGSYESLAVQKGIALYFKSDWDALWVLADRDKLDMIVLNLLSNAIKFTAAGKIELFLQDEGHVAGPHFSLSVRDTGRGIAAKKLPYIFDRFYQADPSDTRTAEGTGIGLAVAKELVELLGGQIYAESIEGQFTELSIRMPYELTGVSEVVQVLESHVPVSLKPLAESMDDGKPLILLIEDHEELRDFISRSLTDDYRVITAADGHSGIELGFEQVPNLVITDLMMPGVDGYGVAATLKNDSRTSHIPIIILTAKADIDSKVLGIETGADAYLAKPFDKRELFALIENLISIRHKLREHYGRQDVWFNDTLTMPSIEQDFITRVRAAIEEHLNEDGYNADQLARDIGLSRTQLHRKLKALIGQAPGELIRIVRLQYAHDLLSRRVATVAEVAYMVGFSSPASFSTSFSRHFGFSPKAVEVV